MGFVYKIIGADEWRAAQAHGIIAPAGIDRADGYIHLSTEDQVLETARLHFAGRRDLIAVAFDPQDFGAALKWEASRGGALFPHLYGALPTARAAHVNRLDPDGATFRFGDLVR